MSETISFKETGERLMNIGLNKETATEMIYDFIAFCKKYNMDPNRAGNDLVRMYSNSQIKEVEAR